MKEILNLARWEFFKIMKTNLAKVLIGLLILIMAGVTVNEYNQYQTSQEDEVADSRESFESAWRDREEFLIEQTQSYMEDPYYSEIQKEAIRRRIEIAEFKLENNISRSVYKNTWYFFSDNMFKGVSLILTLFIAIIAAFSVASEYNDRTLSQILLLPYKRSKILMAKYLASFMYAGVCLGILIVLGTLSGLIVYGFSGAGDAIILSSANGPYVLSSFTYSILVVAMKLLEIALMIFLAVMIAIIAKSSALSVIVTTLMLIIGMPLSFFVSSYNSLWNYTPFLNSDLRKYLEFGSVMPSVESFFSNNVAPGMSWWLSLIITGIYCVIFAGISYIAFCKQDVK